MEKEKIVNAEEKIRTKKDYLILELERPIEYQETHITQIDMTKLRDMTGRELNVIYDLYEASGGTAISLQESTLLFAQVAASRVCGYPLEAIMELKAKDSVYLKNRIYRFFFVQESTVPQISQN